MELEDSLLIEALELANAVKPPWHLFRRRNEEADELISIMQLIIASLERIPRLKVSDCLYTIHGYADTTFLVHFRLKRSLAYKLIDKFEKSNIYTSLSNAGRATLSAEHHILTMLWFLGHETECYRDAADRFGVTLNSLFNIISRVTDFLITLAPQVIKFPNSTEKLKTETYFRENNGFPGVIGVVDSTHIKIDRLSTCGDPESYYNQWNNFSIHMQAVSNEECKFIDVFIGFPGSVYERRVLNESGLLNHLERVCEGGFYLLGDSAYPCLPQLIVPYRGSSRHADSERHFNKKLNSCRIVVEKAFNQLKQRFRFLYHSRLRSLIRTVKVIYACCVLHNLANSEDLEFLTEKRKKRKKNSKNSISKKKRSDVAASINNCNSDKTSCDEDSDDTDIDSLIMDEFDLVSDDEGGLMLRNELCQKLNLMVKS